MIRRLLLAAIIGMISLPMMAQDDDDMYFVPKKQSKDVIEFEMGDGTYDLSARDSMMLTDTDSTYYYDNQEDDFAYSRRMERFDDFYCPSLYSYWNDPFWYDSYGWYSPYRFYCFSGWYGYYSLHRPWYTSWYNPWYNPWYSPWYYDYWGFNYPYYGWGVPYKHYSYRGRPNPARNLTAAGFGGRTRYANRNTIARTQTQRNTFGQRTTKRGDSRYNYNRQQNQQYNDRPINRPMNDRTNGFGSNRGNFGSGFGGGRSVGGGFGGGSRGSFGSRR